MSRTLKSCSISTAQQQRGSIIPDRRGAAEWLVCCIRQVWSAGRSQLQASAAAQPDRPPVSSKAHGRCHESRRARAEIVHWLMQHCKLLFINTELSERHRFRPHPGACRSRASEARVLNEEAPQLQSSLVDGFCFTALLLWGPTFMTIELNRIFFAIASQAFIADLQKAVHAFVFTRIDFCNAFNILSSKSSRWSRIQHHAFSQAPPSLPTSHQPYADSTGFGCASQWISKSSSLFLRPLMAGPRPTSAN